MDLFSVIANYFGWKQPTNQISVFCEKNVASKLKS